MILMTFTEKQRSVWHVINKPNHALNWTFANNPRHNLSRRLHERCMLNMSDPSNYTSQSEEWLAQGGISANGIAYGPPSDAIPWGKAGCPILPRSFRAKYELKEAPSRLIKANQSATVSIGDLDSSFLFRNGLAKLSADDIYAIRNRIHGLSVPSDQTAIPAGVPLRWIMELPVRIRTRNAIQRIARLRGTEDGLEAPISCGEFSRMRSVGKLTVVDLLCVMESVESKDAAVDGRIEFQKTAIANSVAIDNAATGTIPTSTILKHELRDFAGWALAETSAQTVGEAVSEVLLSRRRSGGWEKIAGLDLNQVAGPIRHPYDVLNTWVESLSVRETCVIRDRIVKFYDRRTLQELAEELGTSRERIRQIEKEILTKFKDFVNESEEAKAIRWRAETIRLKIGVAIPFADVRSVFPSENKTTKHWMLLLEAAGPYDATNGWLVLRSAFANDPTREICAMADEFGRIERGPVEGKLSKWGLERSFHTKWLETNSRIREFNGQLVLWGRNIRDRIAFALSDLGDPATVENLIDYVSEKKPKTSVVAALASDPRFVKVSQTRWALVSWNLPKYSGIAMSISEMLQQHGRPMPVEEAVSYMVETFGVPANSARACCQAPTFIIENGLVRLRSAGEPYEFSADTLRSSKGIFALANHRIAILLEIDRQMLRGSGRAVGDAAGALLGLNLDDRMVFHTKHGDSVVITFPSTSISGPSIGSIRSIAERESAGIGDYLTLILDKSSMSTVSLVTDVSEYEASWQLVERLAGIDKGSRMNGLALALRCPVAEVRAVLRSRGDEIVADSIPAISASSRLEAALADLEEQVSSMQCPTHQNRVRQLFLRV